MPKWTNPSGEEWFDILFSIDETMSLKTAIQVVHCLSRLSAESDPEVVTVLDGGGVVFEWVNDGDLVALPSDEPSQPS